MGAASRIEGLADQIRRLAPRDDHQRSLQSRAEGLAEELLQGRWIVSAGAGSSVPPFFLGVLAFWITVSFSIFGLLSPRNATLIAVLLVCSLSVGSAVFIILELDGPLAGLLTVSADPLLFALANLGR